MPSEDAKRARLSRRSVLQGATTAGAAATVTGGQISSCHWPG